jgi:beta-1,4-mannosyl-glycoprotein beta-1,4-N-acetylglucosaminyltransferase
MSIIDAFLFHNEIDVLKMRLELHYDCVDRFCICEADLTFSGKPKDRTFDARRSEFGRWRNKIEYVRHFAEADGLDLSRKDTKFNFSSPAWTLENSQRNNLAAACLKNANDDDIVIISDVDELINPEAFERIKSRKDFDIARLQLLNHYYFMNCRAVGGNKWWCGPIAVRASRLKTINDISSMRPYGEIGDVILQAGWHFSYLGGVERIMDKISSFSHTELDNPDINNAENISKSIEGATDYIGREGHEYAFYPTGSYPDCIQKLMTKNRHLVKWYL